MKKVIIVLGILLLVISIVIGRYIGKNFYFDKPLIRKTGKAGFVEKQVKLDDGSALNYAEGPDNGVPLLLIHGQMVAWPIYMKVLPELSKHYHVYAVDCYGHGKSSKDPGKYSAQSMGEDFIWFIEKVIGNPAIVSGNSSGGLMAAWLAANSPENVLGVVLEDPPFFSCEADRCEKTFAWLDLFKACHNFLEQDSLTDFSLYYLKNNYWINFFGEAKEKIIKTAETYRTKNPNKRLVIYYLPLSLNNSFYFMEEYDPRFGDTFYDCSWMENFDHAETISRIKCPSVLIHANWQYDSNGVLLGAMSDEDALKAHSLIKDNVLLKVKSGHSVSFDNPKEFIRIMVDFKKELE
ncbi:MAG TPA: alpha/beta hydrolase [Prolixibacteraceae bacterium]|nr:alpha/beta hydrolase [Prolixibacteraceae bacterium]